MTKDEALRLALEALEKISMGGDPRWADQAITAIKAALEAKDEPWEQFYPEMGKPKLAYLPPTESPENACYIPPQRTWVGLTRMELIKCGVLPFGMSYELYEAIEQALKERNT
jgi:hypothetical protein